MAKRIPPSVAGKKNRRLDSQTDQETDVPGDTVTDLAKPGQVHKEPLLEQ